ncbi:MAG: isochorismatase family protein [Candidatus Atribacteria bacterium]|nr:isochorismatase family protein [Candidatus Atribacteria bacterium]
MKLKLTGRYFRVRPMDSPGYECEPVELDIAKTALIGMHCWNIGCEDGPEVDPNYPVGLGSRPAYAEEDRILREMIAPAMAAARRSGIEVCHLENHYIGLKDPRAQEDMDRSELDQELINSPETSKTAGKEVVPGWSQHILQRSYGDYLNNSPLSQMNRAKVVEPQPGEIYAFQTGQFDRLLRRRGIENLIYTGFATDHCIMRAQGGAEAMSMRGYRIYLIRDATLGAEYLDTFELRLMTFWGVRYFETHLGDTFLFADFIEALERGAKGG